MAKYKGNRPKTEIAIRDRKLPRSVLEIREAREPREAAKVDYFHLKASWRIKKIQMVDPYSFHQLTAEELSRLRERLSNLETMTWNDIFVTAKKHNHSIPVHELRCEHARKWMKANMPDQLELWTLRVTGVERVWGVFSEGAYQIIFWDPQHRIYPSER
ncbi:MAG TPA: hypothetical protein VMV57_07905 [Terracidiphilus sp.]|nr:hypothetical protein [Terracidiphilus sp.]